MKAPDDGFGDFGLLAAAILLLRLRFGWGRGFLFLSGCRKREDGSGDRKKNEKSEDRRLGACERKDLREVSLVRDFPGP